MPSGSKMRSFGAPPRRVLPRDLLDDGAEEEVAGVVVPELGTRVELEVAAAVLEDEVPDFVGVAADVALEKFGQARVARDAGRVVEQVVDRDACRPCPCGSRAGAGRASSSSDSLPSSTSCITRVAVNCLVIEPRRNLVSGVLGMFHSKSARPIPLLEDHLPVLGDQRAAVEGAHVVVALQQRPDGRGLVVGSQAPREEEQHHERRDDSVRPASHRNLLRNLDGGLNRRSPHAEARFSLGHADDRGEDGVWSISRRRATTDGSGCRRRTRTSISRTTQMPDSLFLFAVRPPGARARHVATAGPTPAGRDREQPRRRGAQGEGVGRADSEQQARQEAGRLRRAGETESQADDGRLIPRPQSPPVPRPPPATPRESRTGATGRTAAARGTAWPATPRWSA